MPPRTSRAGRAWPAWERWACAGPGRARPAVLVPGRPDVRRNVRDHTQVRAERERARRGDAPGRHPCLDGRRLGGPSAAGYQAFVHFVGPDGGILFTDDQFRFRRPPPGSRVGPIATRGRCSFLLASSRGPWKSAWACSRPARPARAWPCAGSTVASRSTWWGRCACGARMRGTGSSTGRDGSGRRHRPAIRSPSGVGWARSGGVVPQSEAGRTGDAQGQTNAQALPAGASLRVSIGSSGATIPITSSELAEWRVLFPAAALGTGRWADIRLVASHTFVPRKLGQGDDRELGFSCMLSTPVGGGVSPLLREGALTAASSPTVPVSEAHPRATGRSRRTAIRGRARLCSRTTPGPRGRIRKRPGATRGPPA